MGGEGEGVLRDITNPDGWTRKDDRAAQGLPRDRSLPSKEQKCRRKDVGLSAYLCNNTRVVVPLGLGQR